MPHAHPSDLRENTRTRAAISKAQKITFFILLFTERFFRLGLGIIFIVLFGLVEFLGGLTQGLVVIIGLVVLLVGPWNVIGVRINPNKPVTERLEPHVLGTGRIHVLGYGFIVNLICVILVTPDVIVRFAEISDRKNYTINFFNFGQKWDGLASSHVCPNSHEFVEVIAWHLMMSARIVFI